MAAAGRLKTSSTPRSSDGIRISDTAPSEEEEEEDEEGEGCRAGVVGALSREVAGRDARDPKTTATSRRRGTGPTVVRIPTAHRRVRSSEEDGEEGDAEGPEGPEVGEGPRCSRGVVAAARRLLSTPPPRTAGVRRCGSIRALSTTGRRWVLAGGVPEEGEVGAAEGRLMAARAVGAAAGLGSTAAAEAAAVERKLGGEGGAGGEVGGAKATRCLRLASRAERALVGSTLT